MKELGEAELKVFVDAVINYFSLTTKEPAQIRSAYLAVTKFRCLHAESPAFILQENSTSKSNYF